MVRSLCLAIFSFVLAFPSMPGSAAERAAGRVIACLVLAAPNEPDGYMQVEDTEQHTDPLAFTSRLNFVVHGPGGTETLFVYKTYDTLVTMHGAPYSHRVATVWESGSAMWTRIFGVSKAGVHLVLERGTHLPPEFTLEGVLINTGWVPIGERCCTASKTEIWTWTGEKYKLTATVPFAKRYEALAKLNDEAKSK